MATYITCIFLSVCTPLPKSIYTISLDAQPLRQNNKFRGVESCEPTFSIFSKISHPNSGNENKEYYLFKIYI
jgi:hypothetical protein